MSVYHLYLPLCVNSPTFSVRRSRTENSSISFGVECSGIFMKAPNVSLLCGG